MPPDNPRAANDSTLGIDRSEGHTLAVSKIGFGQWPQGGFAVYGKRGEGREGHHLLVPVGRVGRGIPPVDSSHDLLKGCLEIIDVRHGILLLGVALQHLLLITARSVTPVDVLGMRSVFRGYKP